jgi:hypothetical protein
MGSGSWLGDKRIAYRSWRPLANAVMLQQLSLLLLLLILWQRQHWWLELKLWWLIIEAFRELLLKRSNISTSVDGCVVYVPKVLCGRQSLRGVASFSPWKLTDPASFLRCYIDTLWAVRIRWYDNEFMSVLSGLYVTVFSSAPTLPVDPEQPVKSRGDHPFERTRLLKFAQWTTSLEKW